MQDSYMIQLYNVIRYMRATPNFDDKRRYLSSALGYKVWWSSIHIAVFKHKTEVFLPVAHDSKIVNKWIPQSIEWRDTNYDVLARR